MCAARIQDLLGGSEVAEAGYILTLAVLDGWRLRGIASNLLRHLLDYLQARRTSSPTNLPSAAHMMQESQDTR